jgi:3-oxoacyl-[acyl-carrier protein] reductase
MSQRKVAIVTGSGTGVGAATARALAARGYDVLVNYSRSAEKAEQVASEVRAAGCDVLVMQGDVAEDAACRAIARAALERWGCIDVLVNNAGMTSFAGTGAWDAIDAELFQRIIAVNALGAFQMIRACAPALRERQGAIVNVSSIAGKLGIGSSVAYIASKGALNAMTLYFARALAPAVRVNAVCPGMIETRWFVDGLGDEGYEKLKAAYESSAPLARTSTAEDVADAVAWFAHSARTVTGETLLLDSGMHLGQAPPIPPAPSR